MAWYQAWKPYVPVAKRRARAAAVAAKLAKKENRPLCPVKASGRTMSQSFWGQAWCQNLERYSDFANRLPRGRTYARNGSVIDLQIECGKVQALVSGSEIYRVSIAIKTLSRLTWKRLRQDCSQSIDSLLELLQGRFDQAVMQRLTQRDGGLFPRPTEIEMDCSCPDWAGLCKHVAAAMYCVGTRLDAAPELLFTLRDVDHLELIGQAVAAENLDRTLAAERGSTLAESNLGELFGIELDAGATPAAKPARRKRTLVATARTDVPKKPRSKSTTTPPARPKANKAAGDRPPAKKLAVRALAKDRPAARRTASNGVVIHSKKRSLRPAPVSSHLNRR